MAAALCSNKDVPDWPSASPPELQSKAAVKDEEEKDISVKMDIDVRSCCPTTHIDLPGACQHPTCI